MVAQEVAAAERIIQTHILRRYESQSTQGEAWRGLPEIPDKSEIMPKEDEKKDFFEEWDAYKNEPLYNVNLPNNIIKGPWPSKDSYIGAHYQILREDAIAGLRTSVKSFKRESNMVDDNFTHVYTDVRLRNAFQVR
jgi:helicase required for RNAi-mediated heterochromatin assembly 1